MSLPFFSIVIPTYNRGHMLSKAIESVIAQTFKDWELLIVDDGSIDNTKEIVQSYSAYDSRVIYIYQENAERCAARNNGIGKARGTFVCFLDSDDYYLADRLQKLYEVCKNQLSPVFYYTGLMLKKRAGALEPVVYNSNGYSVYDRIVLTNIHSQQVCVTRELINTELYDTRFTVGEDTELWLRIAEKTPPKHIEDQYTVVVLEHDERSVNLMKNNSAMAQLKTIRHMFSGNHPGNRVTRAIKDQILSNCYFNIARYYIYNSKRFFAIYYSCRSVLANVKSLQLKFRLNVLIKLILFRPFSMLQELIS